MGHRWKWILLWTVLGGILWGASAAEAWPPRADPSLGIENLNLTGEQQLAFQELQGRFRQEIDQLRKKIGTLRLELRTLSPEEFQGSKGEGIRAEIRTQVIAGRERALFFQNEAWKLLTPDQREKLSAGDDLGFRCHWGGLTGRGPGREFRSPRSSPPARPERPLPQP